MIKGKKIAVIATDGYHNTELTDPMKALIDAGADVKIIGVKPEHLTEGLLDHMTLKSPEKLTPENRLKASALVNSVNSADFDALLIPGGYSPEALRLFPDAVEFVKDIYAVGKPIAAICHGIQLLISAEVVQGKNMTCFASIAIDLKNAGGIYLNKPLVVDNNIITSRAPADMEYFIKGFISVLEK